MKISFEEHGAGLPLLLIHAFPLSRRMWAGQIKPLEENGFRVILPDLFGFGKTPADENEKSLESWAAEINNLLKHLNIEKIIIGGLSMGGYVAFNFYRMFPEKCSALVLADTNSAADSAEKRAKRMELMESIKRHGVKVLIEEMLPNLLSDETKNEKPGLVEWLVQEFSTTPPEAAINALAAMAARKNHNFLLKDIDVPTALIFGEKDRVANLDDARKMAGAIPGAELFVIGKAGHYSNLEQPGEFNLVLLKFLNSLKDNART